MRTFDLAPLWRSTVGFDRLLNLMDNPNLWTGEEQHYPVAFEVLKSQALIGVQVCSS